MAEVSLDVPMDVPLNVEGLNAFYGPAQALFGISLQVRQGEVVVLQGLNGAGKSTLLKALMGLEVRSEGRISYQTEMGRADIERWETHRRARAGLGYVAEDRRLFTSLTVRENLAVAAGRHAAALETQVGLWFGERHSSQILGLPDSRVNANEWALASK